MRVKKIIKFSKTRLSDIRRFGQRSLSLLTFQRYSHNRTAGNRRPAAPCSAASQGDSGSENSTETGDHIPLFFIHIPKTAGTSFRVASEESFGLEFIEKNYGLQSVHTTPLVKKYLLEKTDVFEFHQHFIRSNARMYLGHVNATPMTFVHPLTRTVTFLRQPEKQVLSHYNHAVRWHGSEQTIAEFCKTQRFRDQQTTMIQHVPIHLMGFIGLTEKYEQSLEMFNHTYGTNLSLLNENVNDKKSIETPDDETLALVRNLTKADTGLYTVAQHLFQKRYALYQQNLPWCHGAIQDKNDTYLFGYACWPHSDDPVELILSSNGQDIAETQAVHPSPFLSRFVLPRKGLIGFVFPISELKDGDDIEVRVKRTGQKLERQFIPQPLS